MPIKNVLVVDDSPTERHCLNEIFTKPVDGADLLEKVTALG